jgi:hypothetical protein
MASFCSGAFTRRAAAGARLLVASTSRTRARRGVAHTGIELGMRPGSKPGGRPTWVSSAASTAARWLATPARSRRAERVARTPGRSALPSARGLAGRAPGRGRRMAPCRHCEPWPRRLIDRPVGLLVYRGRGWDPAWRLRGRGDAVRTRRCAAARLRCEHPAGRRPGRRAREVRATCPRDMSARQVPCDRSARQVPCDRSRAT